MLVNADLHIHSKFSMATSKDMDIEGIAPRAREKGLQLVGSGDALHPKWLDIIEESTEYAGDGIYSHSDCDFILTTEVEARHKIHHVIIIPDMETARELSDALPSKNKCIDGRPKTSLDGCELYDLVKQYDCMIGPAHAFTPWTGMYKSYDSIYGCYGGKPDFVELGLSADTDMADTIKELKDFEMEDISYSSLKKAFKHRTIKANYGMLPNLGKYHMTACTKCYKIVDPEIAKENKMKCSCGGRIKKGVDYRIYEISDYSKPSHPNHRPPYIHLMPLAEIIGTVYDKGVTTKTVQSIWQRLIDKFAVEIEVLINAPLEEIAEVDERVVLGIEGFRNKTLQVTPGGGGKYGEISFNGELPEIKDEKEQSTSLDDFF